jgi:hypothetical protein
MFRLSHVDPDAEERDRRNNKKEIPEVKSVQVYDMKDKGQ